MEHGCQIGDDIAQQRRIAEGLARTRGDGPFEPRATFFRTAEEWSSARIRIAAVRSAMLFSPRAGNHGLAVDLRARARSDGTARTVVRRHRHGRKRSRVGFGRCHHLPCEPPRHIPAGRARHRPHPVRLPRPALHRGTPRPARLSVRLIASRSGSRFISDGCQYLARTRGDGLLADAAITPTNPFGVATDRPWALGPCRYLQEPLRLLLSGETIGGWNSQPLPTRHFHGARQSCV